MYHRTFNYNYPFEGKYKKYSNYDHMNNFINVLAFTPRGVIIKK